MAFYLLLPIVLLRARAYTLLDVLDKPVFLQAYRFDHLLTPPTELSAEFCLSNQTNCLSLFQRLSQTVLPCLLSPV